MSACSKIRHIVKLQQILRQWRKKAADKNSKKHAPSDVPAGHVAVRVGSSCKRFIVRASQLNHPLFKKLLILAEEEYGFVNTGPLVIPCDESVFEEIIRFLSCSGSTKLVGRNEVHIYYHVASVDFWAETRPFLSQNC